MPPLFTRLTATISVICLGVIAGQAVVSTAKVFNAAGEVVAVGRVSDDALLRLVADRR